MFNVRVRYILLYVAMEVVQERKKRKRRGGDVEKKKEAKVAKCVDKAAMRQFTIRQREI